MNENVPIATPDWDNVRDYDNQYQPITVPVKLTGTNVVDERPAKRSVMRQFRVPYFGDTNNPPPLEIIPGDPRIKHAWLQANGNNPGDIYVGSLEQVRNAATSTSDAFRLFGSGILGPLEGFQESVYCYALVTGTNILSVRLEYWAD